MFDLQRLCKNVAGRGVSTTIPTETILYCPPHQVPGQRWSLQL
jgi:hypothetical protein